MPRIPTPWSKKRGKRLLGSALSGVAGEVAFYAMLFLLGVFGLSLLLINRWTQGSMLSSTPVPPPSVPGETLPQSNLSFWVFGTLSVAAIVTGSAALIYRLVQFSASMERRSVMARKATTIEMIGPVGEVSQRLPSVPRGTAQTDSPGERLRYRLAPEPTQEGIAGPATLALLWNTAWFVLLAVSVNGFSSGRPRWILTGLLIPFALIGWWSFRFFLTQLRRQAGLGPTIVEISDHPLVPGESYRIYVCQNGRMKLKRLSIRLSCDEETFYRQGTDVRYEKEEAFQQVLWKGRDVLVDPRAPWEQQLAFDLPPGVMHSFVGTHNAIQWKIIVQGESQPWPSFCRSFRVVVHPPGLPSKRNLR